MAVDEVIRTVLADHAHLAVDPTAVGEEDDLYLLGLTSHASVTVMLALEDALDVEFPDDLVRRETFMSLASIRRVLASLAAEEGP